MSKKQFKTYPKRGFFPQDADGVRPDECPAFAFLLFVTVPSTVFSITCSFRAEPFLCEADIVEHLTVWFIFGGHPGFLRFIIRLSDCRFVIFMIRLPDYRFVRLIIGFFVGFIIGLSDCRFVEFMIGL